MATVKSEAFRSINVQILSINWPYDIPYLSDMESPGTRRYWGFKQLPAEKQLNLLSSLHSISVRYGMSGYKVHSLMHPYTGIYPPVIVYPGF
jgi:hypothetical protein